MGGDAAAPWVADLTVSAVLRTTAQAFPDRDAVVFPALGLRWSWRALDECVDRVAAALVDLGVERGEHVGIWSMNAPEWVVTQFAAGRIGAVLVNVNPAYRLHELELALSMADVATLIVGAPFKGSNFVQMVETVCPEVAHATNRTWSAAKLPRLKRVIAIGELPGRAWIGWSELECGEPGPAVAGRECQTAAGDIHNIQFTSGTTGLPKGAMLTHRNVLLNAYYAGLCLHYTAADRVCVPVPFYHCFGCVLGTLVCAVYGAAVVVPAPSFDARATLATIASERCTAVYGVPTMFVAQLDHPDRATFDLSSLRTGIMAGAPCPLPLMKQVMSELGAREITIGYGQTEASPIITMTSVDDPIDVRVGTVGRPVPGLEVGLVDPVTRGVQSADLPGELRVRGHCVMAGYYHAPEATARALDQEGWLYTGDLALCRDDGNYRIVGRSKELIIRGGENIYPPEVEEFLHHHPDVAEVAVVGLPDPKFGEVVSAWVVAKPHSSLTPDALRAYCRGQIAHFKVPQYIEVIAQLPRTVTGKVQKHLLRARGIDDFGLHEADATPTA